MDCALLVAHQDVPETTLAQFVVELNNGTTGIPEQKFYTLFLQTFDNGL
jgi:hypothetical protein